MEIEKEGHVEPETWWPWMDLLVAEDVYFAKRTAMLAGDALGQLRLALADIDGARTAARILRQLPIEMTMDLIEPVFNRATEYNGRTGPAKEAIARVDAEWLFSALPPLINGRLSAPETDYADYSAVASLLRDLGQHAHLREVVAKAARSTDPDIREVAEDFRVES